MFFMEIHKSRVVNFLDNQLLDSIRQIMREETADIKEDISVLKTDVANLKADVSGLKEDMSVVKTDVANLKTDVSGLKEDVDGLKSQVGENTIILRALEENKDIQKAQMDRIENDIAELKGGRSRLLELEDEFIEHTHQIIIETSKPQSKAG